MWARTLWPLLSSTRNIALGRASTTVPSISMTPSFLGMSSAFLLTALAGCPARAGPGVRPFRHTGDGVLAGPDQPRGPARTLMHVSRQTSLRQRPCRGEIGPGGRLFRQGREAHAEGRQRGLAAVPGGQHPGTAVG